MARRRDRSTTPTSPSAEQPPASSASAEEPSASQVAEEPPRRVLIYKLSSEQREKLKAEQAQLTETRRLIDEHLEIRDGLKRPPWQRIAEGSGALPATEVSDRIESGVTAKQLPSERPEDIEPMPWLAANKIYSLWIQGYRAPNREELRTKINEGISQQSQISLESLKTALEWLRDHRFISRSRSAKRIK